MNPRAIFFDAYLLVSFFIWLTGGTTLLTPDLLDFVRNNPKYHRLFLMVASVIPLIFLEIFHFKGELKNRSFLVKFIEWIQIKPAGWTIFLFFFLGIVLSYSSFMRHYVFRSSFDFAIFAQAVWNTCKGDFLYSSVKGGICLLGDHVSPILISFVPLYLVWNDPIVLLVVQAFAASSAVIPIYLIGKKVLDSEKYALLFSFAYVLYLPVRNAVRFDFHPEIVGIPLFLWAFYLIITNRFICASFFLFFVLLTKETACIPVAMLGLYTWWFLKKAPFGILWTVVAVIAFIAGIYIVAPYFSSQEYFYLRGNYLSWKEESSVLLLHHLIQPSTFAYLKKIFLPLGFFSILSPKAFLLTGPALAQNLLAKNTLARSIFFQYTVFLTPFVFISAICGFKNFLDWAERLSQKNRTKFRRIGAYWLLAWSIIFSGVSEFHIIREHERQNNPHLNYVRQYLKTVPSHFSVRTHEFLAPHLVNRKGLHIYENTHPREGGSEKAQDADLVIIDQHFLPVLIHGRIKELKTKGYSVAHQHDGFYVMKRNDLFVR